MTDQYLLVFSIGPVQSFIASAQKTEDLWSGSYLLSDLTKCAINIVNQHEEALLLYPQPMVDQNREETFLASLPNRLVCKISASEQKVAAIARDMGAAVKKRLIDDCHSAIDRVFPSSLDVNELKRQTKEQIEDFLEIFWAIDLYNDTFTQSRRRLEKRLAAIKNNRAFRQTEQTGLVCTLCGERDALCEQPFKQNQTIGEMNRRLRQTWDRRQAAYTEKIEEKEALCGICLGKRLLRERTGHERFPSTLEISGQQTYYAIVMMDGDNMGEWFSGNYELEHFQPDPTMDANLSQQIIISHRLSRFSKKVLRIVNKTVLGRLVYAGGDDVLAFLPVKNLFTILGELRSVFSDRTSGLDPKASASAGVAIVHEKTPLSVALQHVRWLEKQAKSYQNERKNALALSLMSRSGETRWVVLPWFMKENDQNVCQLINEWIGRFNKDYASTFLYTFGQSFLPLVSKEGKLSIYEDDPEQNQDLLQTEITRLLRRASDNVSNEQLVEDAGTLVKLHSLCETSLSFYHLLEIIRAFSRKKGVKS